MAPRRPLLLRPTGRARARAAVARVAIAMGMVAILGAGGGKGRGWTLLGNGPNEGFDKIREGGASIYYPEGAGVKTVLTPWEEGKEGVEKGGGEEIGEDNIDYIVANDIDESATQFIERNLQFNGIRYSNDPEARFFARRGAGRDEEELGPRSTRNDTDAPRSKEGCRVFTSNEDAAFLMYKFKRQMMQYRGRPSCQINDDNSSSSSVEGAAIADSKRPSPPPPTTFNVIDLDPYGILDALSASGLRTIRWGEKGTCEALDVSVKTCMLDGFARRSEKTTLTTSLPTTSMNLPRRSYVKSMIEALQGGGGCPANKTEAAPFRTKARMLGLLSVVATELSDVPLLFKVEVMPKMKIVVNTLSHLGFRVSISHTSPNAYKTNAPSEVLFALFRSWRLRELNATGDGDGVATLTNGKGSEKIQEAGEGKTTAGNNLSIEPKTVANERGGGLLSHREAREGAVSGKNHSESRFRDISMSLIASVLFNPALQRSSPAAQSARSVPAFFPPSEERSPKARAMRKSHGGIP
eukprot:jgi/Bigna1/82371/fgenesh1_pg.91_\